MRVSAQNFAEWDFLYIVTGRTEKDCFTQAQRNPLVHPCKTEGLLPAIVTESVDGAAKIFAI